MLWALLFSAVVLCKLNIHNMSGAAWGALNLLLHFVQNPAPVYKQEDVWSLPMTDLLDLYSSSLWRWPEYTDFCADTVVEQRPKVILGGRSQNSHLLAASCPLSPEGCKKSAVNSLLCLIVINLQVELPSIKRSRILMQYKPVYNVIYKAIFSFFSLSSCVDSCLMTAS